MSLCCCICGTSQRLAVLHRTKPLEHPTGDFTCLRCIQLDKPTIINDTRCFQILSARFYVWICTNGKCKNVNPKDTNKCQACGQDELFF